jgi:NADPH2:quinone reductase
VKAIQITRHGGPEVLETVDLPDPEPGPGQIAIALEATAVNYADVLMARGVYPGVKAPTVPGLEAAGTVVAVGSGVTRFAPGNRVMALVRGGSYATRVIAREYAAVPVPGTFSWAEAGSFMETFYTAWLALFTIGRAQPEETVLVMAAAGGVGTAALQLALKRGVRAIAAAGSPEKLQAVRYLATGGTIDYNREDLTARVKELTNGRGVDVVLESVGGKLALAAFEALAPLGRLVVFGAASGEFAAFPTHKLLGRTVTLSGLHLGRVFEECPEAMEDATAGLMGLVARGQVRPLIGATLPLASARRAHEMMLARQTVGKIVLVPEGA